MLSSPKVTRKKACAAATKASQSAHKGRWNGQLHTGETKNTSDDRLASYLVLQVPCRCASQSCPIGWPVSTLRIHMHTYGARIQRKAQCSSPLSHSEHSRTLRAGRRIFLGLLFLLGRGWLRRLSRCWLGDYRIVLCLLGKLDEIWFLCTARAFGAAI